ncbi:hypothetical protein HGRIS_005654 [Hohenbuehelia grisea]|uniref:Uncharacterized protein n=1 Tax=Hohenbuehelia grisea TaxID=104357 RepID=A0ABR3JZB9_9AGAR
MIAAIARAATIILVPLIQVAATVLLWLAFMSPVMVFKDRLSLLTVNASTSGNGTDSIVFLGALGSCTQLDGQPPHCTPASLSPKYNFSALPSNAPVLSLSAPATVTLVFLVLSLALSTLFVLTFAWTSFSDTMRENGDKSKNSPMNHITSWFGFLGLLIGFTAFIDLRIWFGKAASDFKANAAAKASDGSAISATVGNGFYLVYVGYILHLIPVLIIFSKIASRHRKHIKMSVV